MKYLLPTLILAFATTAAWAQAPASTKSAKAKTIKGKNPTAQPAAEVRASDRALTPVELALASHVIVGRVPCELGKFVSVSADAQSPGYFELQFGKKNYRMSVVESRTGVIRLETPTGDAMWMQMGSKSMLMDAKLGQRVADVCRSPEQVLVAQAIEKSPPPNILDDPKVEVAPIQTCNSTTRRPASTRDGAETC